MVATRAITSGRAALLARLRADGLAGCLIVLRVRKLAAIADLAGAAAAEHVAAMVVARIVGLVDAGDFVADLGDATFALVVSDDERRVESRCESLVAAISRDIPYGEKVLFA